MSDVLSGRRFYLRSRPALVGAPRQTSASHEAAAASTCDMTEDPGNQAVNRIWSTTPSGDVFFGSWISPALAAGVVATGNWLFNVACREIASACNFLVKHTVYLWRQGAIAATLLATVTEASEAPYSDGALAFFANESDTLNLADGNGLSIQAATTYYYRSWVPRQSGWLRKITYDLYRVGAASGNLVTSLRTDPSGSDLFASSLACTSIPSVGGSETADQLYDTANMDASDGIGSAAGNVYHDMGATAGAIGTGAGMTKFSLYLWRSGTLSDNITASMRNSASGSDIGSVNVAASTVGNSVGAASKDQDTATGSVSSSVFYGATWKAQSFTAGVSNALAQCKVYLRKFNSPTGNATFALRATAAGPDLATATIDVSTLTTAKAQYTLTFSPNIWIASGSVMFIVARYSGGDATNNIGWFSVGTNPYAGGSSWTSTDSGASWADNAGDRDLETWMAAPTFAWVDFTLSATPGISTGDQIYLNVRRTGSADVNLHVRLGYDSTGSYAGANNYRRYSADGVTWTDQSGHDLIFRTYYKAHVANQLVEQTLSAPYYVTGGTKYYEVVKHDGTGVLSATDYVGWHTLSMANYLSRVPDQDIATGSSIDSGASWTVIPGAFQSRYEVVGADGQAPFYPRAHTVSVGTFTAQEGDRILYEMTGAIAQAGGEIQFDGAALPDAGESAACLGGAASYLETTPAISLLWDTLLADPRASSYPIVYFHAPIDLYYCNASISGYARPAHGEILSIGDLSRGIGDEYGTYSVSDITIKISDTTGRLRAWIDQAAQTADPVLEYRKLIGKTVSVGMLLYRASDGISDSRDVFRGIVNGVESEGDKMITLRIKAESFFEMNALSQVYSYAVFPFMTSAILNNPCNLVFGSTVSGVICYQIDTSAYRFLVSLGKCTVTAVYKDTTLLTLTTDYTIENVTLLNGLRATYINLVAVPGSSVISATVVGIRGLPDAAPGEYIITNPAEALYEILSTYGPLYAQQIDFESYTAAYNALAARGMAISGAFYAQTTVGALLSQFAQQFDMDFFVTMGGRLGMSVVDFADTAAAPALRTSESEIDGLQYSHKENLRYDGTTINYGWNTKNNAYASTDNVYVDATRAREIYNTWDWITTVSNTLTPGYWGAQRIATGTTTDSDPRVISSFTVYLKVAAGFIGNVGVSLKNAPDGTILYTTTIAGTDISSSAWTKVTIKVPTGTVVYWQNDIYVVVFNTSASHDLYLPDKADASGSGLWLSPSGAYGTFIEVSPGQILLAISVTRDYLDTALERVKTFSLSLLGDLASVEVLRTQFMRKHSNPHPLFLRLTLPRRALAVELGELIEVNHRAGLAVQFNRLQCQLRSISYDYGSAVKMELRINDVLDAIVLGDDSSGVQTWASATIEDKRYWFLCDDTTGKFSDGTIGRSLGA